MTTEQYGLVGYPLEHSYSKKYFTGKFVDEGIKAKYDLFPLESIDSLPGFIADHPELRGFNVTIPYKEKIVPLLDALSEDAEEIGAVNTVRIETDSNGVTKMKGYNTDWSAFLKCLVPLANQEIKEALVLGTGGAAKAAAYTLNRYFGTRVTFVSRNPSDCGFENSISYEDLSPGILKRMQLIVNATPVGMFPANNLCPDLPYISIQPGTICFDMVYNPEETEFMQRSAKQGAIVSNGFRMLALQADEAWEIWQAK